MIVDACVILAAFFPDEQQAQAQAVVRDHVMRRVRLAAPPLLPFEITNAVLKALRRERITAEQAETILSAFEDLHLSFEPVDSHLIVALGIRYGCSAYDAAYLALAQSSGEPLLTDDLRLYNAITESRPAGKADSAACLVQWVGDYQGTGQTAADEG